MRCDICGYPVSPGYVWCCYIYRQFIKGYPRQRVGLWFWEV